MPNRILRDWTDSYAVHELNAAEERFFVRLLMKADDFGRFHGSPKLLKAALFPLHSLDDNDVTKWRDKCSKEGLIDVYEDERGRVFLEVKNFNQRTRATSSKYPARSGGSQVTVTRPSSDRLDGDGDGDGDGGECDARAGEFAEMPTVDEVIDHGNGGAAIPAWYCKHYHEQKEIRRSWLNGHGKLINWRREVVAWFNKDGKPLRENEHAKSNRGGGRKANATAGTFNEGIAHIYANAAKPKT